MILHILKLIKARLKSCGWILAELMVVFCLLWYVTDYFLMQGILQNRPVGYDLTNVYQAVVSLRPSNSSSFVAYEDGSEEPLKNLLRIQELIARHPDVEAVCLSNQSLPYSFPNFGNQIRYDSLIVQARNMYVTPGYFRVFGIRPATGGSPDELAQRLPDNAMINTNLAEKIFGRTDVVGREVVFNMEDTLPHRTTAVTQALRNDEYDTQKSYLCFFHLDNKSLAGEKESSLSQMQLCFRIREGAAAPDYAQYFMKSMKRNLQAGNFWVSDIRPYTDIRSSYLNNSIDENGFRLVSIMAVFFLVNVFLAVIGTFWFQVNRRRSELGIRMVTGSTRSGLHRLVTGEGLMLLAIASIPALVICLNLAYMDLLSTSVTPVTAWRLLLVSLLTWGVLALVVAGACWYPSLRASRMAPAEALHYE